MRQKIWNTITVIVYVLLAVTLVYNISGHKFDNETTTSPTVTNSYREVTIKDTDGLAVSVAKVYNSVVVVHVDGKRTSGWGSGFVYKVEKNNTYIITNHHVIENADDITVEFMDNTEVKATLVGSDMYADIAVLKIETIEGVEPVLIGKTSELRLGDTIFTVGTPISLDYKGSVTRGVVSGLDRLVSVSISNSYTSDYIMKAIQIDAPINSGNSGGPLCNTNGEVIGVNTMKIASQTTENIGFSIAIEDAIDIATIILEKGKVERPYLGLEMYELASAKYVIRNLNIADDVEGLYVNSVEASSPASKAGVKKGDIITKMGDYAITSFSEFRYYLFKFKPGDKVNIVVLRDNKEKTISVTLGSSED